MKNYEQEQQKSLENKRIETYSPKRNQQKIMIGDESMNKDEQLVVQVLNAYKNGKIDFSNVPELDRLVRQEVNKDFRDYQEK